MKTSLPLVLKSSLFPSRPSNTHQSYIDLFIISVSLNILYEPGFPNFLKTLPYESDHVAVCLEIALDSKILHEDKTTAHNYPGTNWQRFNLLIGNQIKKLTPPIDRNMSALEIDDTLEKLSEIFNKTIETIVPKTSVNCDSQIPLPNNIISLINYKNSLRRTLHKKRYSTNSFLLKSQIKCLIIMIKNSIRSHYNNYYSSKLAGMKMDHNIFKNIKRFSSYKAREFFPDIISNGNGTRICGSLNKAEALAIRFSDVHKKNINLENVALSDNINHLIANAFNSSEFLTEFSANNTADIPTIPSPSNRLKAILSFCKPEEIRLISKYKNNKKKLLVQMALQILF